MDFSIHDLLNYSQVILLPVIAYLVKIERRVTRIETLVELLTKDKELNGGKNL